MWLIALTVSSSVMGLTLLTPALPLVQEDLGVSSGAVQQLLTVYLIALAVGQLVYGTASDRFGRRPILLFGALLYGIGGAAAAVADNIETLTFYRVIQGLGSAACLSMGKAIINDCFDRTAAAQNLSTVSAMLAVVPILALAFGGILVQTSGWAGTMVVISVGGFLVFALSLFMIRETNLNRASSISITTVVSAYGAVLQNRIFVLFTLTSGMQVGMFFALNGFLPYQYQRLGYSPIEFGLWFSLTPVSYLLGNTVNRLYFVSRGIEKAAMIGCSLTLISVLAFYATQAAGMTHALSLAIPGILFGFANGIVIANTTIGAISASGRYAGTGTGLTGAWQMTVGGVAGAIIVGMGGAQNFQLAAGGLIIMSLISVGSIFYVYQQRDSLG
jgi:DHA1 family bicyclomycin/chloramphenicol resistance-like MFS transporter